MCSSPEEIPVASSHRVNDQFADRFFRKIFERTKAIQDLLHYIGEPIEPNGTCNITEIQPVLIGNRRNDFSFFLNWMFYYFFEHQSTENDNIPARMLIYISQALEAYLRGKPIYGKYRLKLPEVKCYLISTGIAEKTPKQLESIQKLSDAYLSSAPKRNPSKPKKSFDLELCVHCFDLRATMEEMAVFTKENRIPERLKTIENIVVQYAMFVNTIKYQLREENVNRNTVRAKQIVFESCQLFLERNYLTAYFHDQEVIDMAVEQLTYEEIIRFQEREVGIEEGIKKGEREKLKDQVRKKLKKGKSAETIAEELEDDLHTIWQVMIEVKKESSSEENE